MKQSSDFYALSEHQKNFLVENFDKKGIGKILDLKYVHGFNLLSLIVYQCIL